MLDKIWYNMEELIGGSEERVLIETQWNVKDAGQSNVNSLSRINRNIVECKDHSKWSIAQKGDSINRNIVECKDERASNHW